MYMYLLLLLSVYNNDRFFFFVFQEIQRRENSYSGRLCDISGSFFLPYSQDDILLKLTDFEGMHMYLGSDEPMVIILSPKNCP